MTSNTKQQEIRYPLYWPRVLTAISVVVIIVFIVGAATSLISLPPALVVIFFALSVFFFSDFAAYTLQTRHWFDPQLVVISVYGCLIIAVSALVEQTLG